MKILLVLALAFMLSFAAPRTANFKVNSIVSVYDGDTIRVNMNCTVGFFCDNMSIRVWGIDTPERRGGTGTKLEKYKAKIATSLTKKFVYGAEDLYLEDCIKGKYFRLVCKVKNEKGIYLSDYLIDSTFAVPYYGGTKTKDWCK